MGRKRTGTGDETRKGQSTASTERGEERICSLYVYERPVEASFAGLVGKVRKWWSGTTVYYHALLLCHVESSCSYRSCFYVEFSPENLKAMFRSPRENVVVEWLGLDEVDELLLGCPELFVSPMGRTIVTAKSLRTITEKFFMGKTWYDWRTRVRNTKGTQFNCRTLVGHLVDQLLVRDAGTTHQLLNRTALEVWKE
jgi:hypothetical protein